MRKIRSAALCVSVAVVVAACCSLHFGKYRENEVPRCLLEAKALAQRPGSRNAAQLREISKKVDYSIKEYAKLTVSGKKTFIELLDDPLLATPNARVLLRSIVSVDSTEADRTLRKVAINTLHDRLDLFTAQEWQACSALPAAGVQGMALLAGGEVKQPAFVTDWLQSEVANNALPVPAKKEVIYALRRSRDKTTVSRLCREIPKLKEDLATEAALTIQALPLRPGDASMIFKLACAQFRNTQPPGGPIGEVTLPIEPSWLILVTYLGNKSYQVLQKDGITIDSTDPAAMITSLECLTRSSGQPYEFHLAMIDFALTYDVANGLHQIKLSDSNNNSTEISIVDYLTSLLVRSGPPAVPAFETRISANSTANGLPVVLDAYLAVVEAMSHTVPDASKVLLDRFLDRAKDPVFADVLYGVLAKTRHVMADQFLSQQLDQFYKNAKLLAAIQSSGGVYCSSALQEQLNTLAAAGRLSTDGEQRLICLAYLDLPGGFHTIYACADKNDASSALKQYVVALSGASASEKLSDDQKRRILSWILRIGIKNGILPLAQTWKSVLTFCTDNTGDASVNAYVTLLGLQDLPSTSSIHSAVLSVPWQELIAAVSVSPFKNSFAATAQYELENAPLPIAGLYQLFPNDPAKHISDFAANSSAAVIQHFREVLLSSLRKNPVLNSWDPNALGLPPLTAPPNAEPAASYFAQYAHEFGLSGLTDRNEADSAPKTLALSLFSEISTYLQAKGFAESSAQASALLLLHEAAQQAVLECYADWFGVANSQDANRRKGARSLIKTQIVDSVGDAQSDVPTALQVGDVASFKIVERKLGKTDHRCFEEVLIYDTKGSYQTLRWSSKVSGQLFDLFINCGPALDRLGFCVAFRDIFRGKGGLQARMGAVDGIITNPWEAIRLLANAKSNSVDAGPLLALALANLAESQIEVGIRLPISSAKEPDLPSGAPAILSHRSGILNASDFSQVVDCAHRFADFIAASNTIPIAQDLRNRVNALLPDSYTEWYSYQVPTHDGQYTSTVYYTAYSHRTVNHPFKKSVLNQIDQAIASAKQIISANALFDVSSIVQQSSVNAVIMRVFLREDQPAAAVIYALTASDGSQRLWVSQLSFNDSNKDDWQRLKQVSDWLPGFPLDLGELLDISKDDRNAAWQQLSYLRDLRTRDVLYLNKGICGVMLPLLQAVKADDAAKLSFSWIDEVKDDLAMFSRVAAKPLPLQATSLGTIRDTITKVENDSKASAKTSADDQYAAVAKAEQDRRSAWSISIGVSFGGGAPMFTFGGSYGNVSISISTNFQGQLEVHPSVFGVDLTPLLLSLNQHTGPSDQELAFTEEFRRSMEPTPWPPLDGGLSALQPDGTSDVTAPQVEHHTSPYVGPTIGPAPEPLERSYKQMLAEDWEDNPFVAKSLSDNQTKLQKPDQNEPILEDEWGCVVASMPLDLSAGQFFSTFKQNFNKTLDSTMFDFLGTFKRQDQPQWLGPEIGDIYNITPLYGWGSLVGSCVPSNAPIIIVDQQSNNFTVATLEGHPEAGVRMFGYKSYPDGSTVFYTRGVSQPSESLRSDLGNCTSFLVDNPVWSLPAAQKWAEGLGTSVMLASQQKYWNTYVNHVCSVLQSKGAVIQGTYGPQPPPSH